MEIWKDILLIAFYIIARMVGMFFFNITLKDQNKNERV